MLRILCCANVFAEIIYLRVAGVASCPPMSSLVHLDFHEIVGHYRIFLHHSMKVFVYKILSVRIAQQAQYMIIVHLAIVTEMHSLNDSPF